MQRCPLTLACGLPAAILVLAGCSVSRQIRDPEYAGVVNAVAQSPDVPAPRRLPPVATQLAGPQPVDVYVEYALAQNADIQAARKQVEAAANRVPQAASLQDPTLAATAYPAPVQTAAGRQEFGLNASQHLPWFGKLDARAGVAEEETNIARARLAVVELEVIEQVKRAYYELYFVQKAIRITEDDRRLLTDLSAIAESKYRTGTVSQQDVLRAQVEVSNLDSQLIRLRQELETFAGPVGSGASRITGYAAPGDGAVAPGTSPTGSRSAV